MMATFFLASMMQSETKTALKIDQVFIGGKHNILICIVCHNHSSFNNCSIKYNSIFMFLFKQSLKDVENNIRDVAGYDMNYLEFKDLCPKAWEKGFNYLCIEKPKKKDRGRYRIFNESKITYIECIPETEPF